MLKEDIGTRMFTGVPLIRSKKKDPNLQQISMKLDGEQARSDFH